MVRVVPGVPDSNILEQTSVRPQNVVCLGPHHLSLPPHVPRPSVPTTPSPSRHEMLRHIFNSTRLQNRRYVLRPSSLRRQGVHVKIPRHHQFRSRRHASYRLDHRLHGPFVLGGDVCPDNVPASLPRRHLEHHHIRPAPLHRLHHEVRCEAVEKCDAAAVSDRRIRHFHMKAMINN